MKATSLLIPVAAFAVTATSVSAFNPDVLQEAGLSDEQITAFAEARELKQDGDRDGARDVLIEAGIDQETMESVREAVREHRTERREAVGEAIDNNDFTAFQTAIEGSPLADIVTTEADFELFAEARALKEAGDREAAREILDELGIEKKPGKQHRGGERGGGFGDRTDR